MNWGAYVLGCILSAAVIVVAHALGLLPWL